MISHADEIKKLRIIVKPDDISWEEITELLHAAFKERKEQGLSYLATRQSVETTKKRVADGTCLVALIDNRLVGTVTLQINDVIVMKRKWYHENSYAYSKQLAVHPDYKRKGIGKALQDARLKLCYDNNVDALIFDTSYKAKSLISRFLRLGAQKVEFISHPTTNYYSIVFRIAVKGKEFNRLYMTIRYYLSALICVLIKDEDGHLRLLGKFLKMVLNKKSNE